MVRMTPIVMASTTVVLCLMPLGVGAQDDLPQELDQLNTFVGTWSIEADDGSGVQVCDWFGVRFVRCEIDYTRTDGSSLAGLDLYGYDETEDVYTYHRIWSNGYNNIARGWRQDSVWVWLYDETSRSSRSRHTFEFESESVVSTTLHVSSQGGPWEYRARGRWTRND